MEQPKYRESEVLMGIAKKINAELEDVNVRDHGAVLSMLGTLGQRRAEIFNQQLRDEAEAKQKEMLEMQAGLREPRIVRPL